MNRTAPQTFAQWLHDYPDRRKHPQGFYFASDLEAAFKAGVASQVEVERLRETLRIADELAQELWEFRQRESPTSYWPERKRLELNKRLDVEFGTLCRVQRPGELCTRMNWHEGPHQWAPASPALEPK